MAFSIIRTSSATASPSAPPLPLPDRMDRRGVFEDSSSPSGSGQSPHPAPAPPLLFRKPLPVCPQKESPDGEISPPVSSASAPSDICSFRGSHSEIAGHIFFHILPLLLSNYRYRIIFQPSDPSQNRTVIPESAVAAKLYKIIKNPPDIIAASRTVFLPGQ